MKAILAKVLSGLLSFAVCIGFFGMKAGEAQQNQPSVETAAAQVEKSASPLIADGAEFKVIAKLPESKALKAVAKVSKPQQTAAANSSEPQKAVPPADSDVVTIWEFGGEFLYGYLAGLNNLTNKLVDTGGEFPEFVFEYDDDAGVHQEIYMGMYFDEENQLIIGRDQQGAFAIGFDVDLKQKMIYSAYNGWERNLGFCRLYDLLAPAAGIFYETQRIKFEYDGLDWMIQLWKGSYFIALTGGEMGIYSKPKSRLVEFYDCVGDEDMLEMSMRILKGDRLLLERLPQKHWWLTGVALTESMNHPSLITMEGSILFEDAVMLEAFLAAFEKVCAQADIAYTVEGLLVRFTWQ